MKGKHTLSKLTIVLATVVSTLVSSAAYAAGPTEGDFFGRITAPPPKPTTAVRIPAATPTMPKPEYHYGEAPMQKWFAALDAEIGPRLVTESEMTILTGSFGNPPQLERVIEWTNTAATVARRYRSLAKIVRSMRVPEDAQAGSIKVDFFRNQMAQNYDDQAAVLEEYIKPRRPARTQEELDEQLARVHEESESTKNSSTHIAEMDSKLRSHFGVRTAQYRDALWSYVARKPN